MLISVRPQQQQQQQQDKAEREINDSITDHYNSPP